MRPSTNGRRRGGAGRAATAGPLLGLLLAGCGLSGEQTVDGPYRLSSADILEDTMLCLDVGGDGCVGRVEPAVFAAGFDSRYIVAARHPHKFEDSGLDRSRTEYFYVIRSRDGLAADVAEVVKGPFDRDSFARETARLHLPGFSVRIPNLE